MPICRICKAEENLQSVRADYVFGGSEHYKFWECRSCKAIYMDPKLTPEEEKHFYKKEFEKFMAQRVGDHRDWSNAENHIKTNQDQVERRWKFLSPHLKPGLELLEIGCSSGFMLDAFHTAGLQCTGVEPSGEFLEFLQKKGYRAYESLEELTKNDPKQYDLISHFFVFEHIADPFAFLQETYGLLKEGGVIIAEIPSATDPLTSLYTIPSFEKFYWSIAHHYYYTPDSLRYILDTLGYNYELLPEQRYDLSNHMTWMMDGKPGGQNRYNDIFSPETLQSYREDLKRHWRCDTVILKIYKESV
ncbi:Methyltransferase type 12 [Sulfuricurvum kujiense DSM 16994]|uniref:Methyltransferase type 12 n=1 Tax=Sulfuricurvum kujiense (strain ATCC BAA-921 / DSM 16994 / JCM 11577 / YK-1) TaxID=709032 RepID=E4TYB2_SULKY|nr:class I SAM-dependent methyltransferase [Sulfuricurvum kujiense]ADR35057.1 Methyltransferase type 12 [Sulfuricurvum kujiense DSM 16994]